MSDNTTTPSGEMPDAATTTEKVGAFDIRNFIGALIGLYRIILLILGLVAFNDDAAARTGGVNANLWAGVGMIVVAALFMLWAKLAPLKVEVPTHPSDGRDPA